MSNCALDFALANQEQFFVKLETVCGTLVYPSAADRAYTVGPVDFGQERELLPDAQIRASASQLSFIKARLTPGDFSFTTYCKPSGVLGTKPEHAALFQAAFGLETITPATKVEYTLENQLDSVSIWFKKGHSVFALRGATVEQVAFKIEGQSISEITWSGKFMERLWAGECQANDTCGIAKETITLWPTGALRYTPGMRVTIGTDTNTDLGYTITEVNFAANTIKISPTLGTDQGTNPIVYPWLPSTGFSEVGEPAHGKLGLVTVNGVNAVVTSANVTLANNIKYYENEKNNSWSAERFARPGMRTVEGTITCFFLKQGLSYFYRADYVQKDALIIPVGNVAGKIMEISIPYAQYKAPKITGTEEFEEELNFIGVASSSLNDEAKVTFK